MSTTYTASGIFSLTMATRMDDTSKWHKIWNDYNNQEIYTTASYNYDRNGSSPVAMTPTMTWQEPSMNTTQPTLPNSAMVEALG